MVTNLDLPPEPGSAPAQAVEPPEQGNRYSQDASVAFAAPWSLVPGEGPPHWPRHQDSHL